MITENMSSGAPNWSVEAKCLEIEEPEFDSKNSGDKAPGIEDARKFALASLDKATTFIKLDRLWASSFKGKWTSEADFRQQITTLIARSARESAVPDVPMAVSSKNIGS